MSHEYFLFNISVYTDIDYSCLICIVFIFRFDIEKKLRQAKKQQQKKKDKQQYPDSLIDRSTSQRSKERRKNMEDKKDTGKFSVLKEMKAKREEKRRQGK